MMTQPQFDAAVGDGRFADLLKETFFRNIDGTIAQRVALATSSTAFGSAARGASYDASVAAIIKLLATGSDSNIDVEVAGKGTGGFIARVLGWPLVQGRSYNALLASQGYVGKVQTDLTAGTTPFAVATAPNGLLYVCNAGAGTVSVINPANGALVTTITAGSAPRGICYCSSVDRLYVSNTTGGTVSVINPNTNAVTTTISSLTAAWGIAWSPLNDRLYIASSTGASTSLFVVNPQTNTLVTTITVGSFPLGVMFCPSNGQIYVTNNNATTVSVVTPSTNTVATTITVGTAPYGLCYCPTSDRIFVSNGTSGSISVINPTTNTVAATIASVTSAANLLYSPTTDLVYCGTAAANGQLVVINPATNAVMSGAGYTLTSITINGMAFHPPTGQVYVAESGGKLAVVI